MVKITADLISRSAQYLNPVKEFQLDLRGYKISAIENLSATNDQFGCIDLSDNSITFLEVLPKLHRLRNLLLINNRIIKVDKEFALTCPNLENLMLTANKVSCFYYYYYY
jgi:U2 small nuclear ribonucleoprotein A'